MPDSNACAENRRLSRDARELALSNYNHIEQQATLAATKSALLVAAHALLAAAYVSVAKDWEVFAYPPPLHVWPYAAAGVFVAAAFLVSLWAIVPKSRVDDPSDLLFFASIAQRETSDNYLRQYQETTDAQLDRMLLRTIHGKSVWLRKNFYFVRLAIFSSCLGTVCVVASVVLIACGQ